MIGTRAQLIRLAERRMRLAEHARAERDHLMSVVARTDEAAAVVVRVRDLLAQLRRQPLLIAAGVALLVALRPSRAFGWLMRGWGAWRMYRSAMRWWQQFSARSASAGGI
jgi:hypothetical protein